MGIEKHEDVRANLAPGQKLTLADIRQTSPDFIEIVHIEGDLRPEHHFVFILVKENRHIHYNDEELALSTEEMSVLKDEFQVKESTLQGTPGPAAMKKAQMEWEEWEKKHGKRPRYRPDSAE